MIKPFKLYFEEIVSSLYYAFAGLIGGLISTLLMTLTEIPSWKKWGLHGVFEWHENEIITSRLFFSRISNAKQNTKETEDHFRNIFLSFSEWCLSWNSISIHQYISFTFR
jgi:hypothetical protein